MYEKQRTNALKLKLSRILDNKLLLVYSKRYLNTLFGIKISIGISKDTRISQDNAVNDIIQTLESKTFKFSALDRLRLNTLILPKLGGRSLDWDSVSLEVSFEDALELFEADLNYLLSEDLSSRLPPSSAEARERVLAQARRTPIHWRIGRGSKITYPYYQRLVTATRPGWISHIAELNDQYFDEAS